MKLPRFFTGIKNPIELIEQYTQRKWNKDTFLILIACVVSLGGFVHGFIITQSELLLTNVAFLTEFDGIHDSGATESAATSASMSRMGPNSVDSVMMNPFSTHFINVFYLGELLGALCVYPFNDTFGRKSTMLMTTILGSAAVAWGALVGSSSSLFSTRFFLGIAIGGMMSTATVYIAEVTTAIQRGQCITFISINTILGSLSSLALYHISQHSYFGWRISLFVLLLVMLLQIYFLSFLPDSPRWLLAKLTPTDCSLALKQLRRSNDVRKEFNDMYRALSTDARLGDSWLELLFSKSIKLRALLTGIIQLAQQLVGIQIVTLFGYSLIKEIGVKSVEIAIFLVLLSGGLGSVMLLYFIDERGRRVVLIIGSLGMSLAWFSAAITAYIGGIQTTPDTIYFSSYFLRVVFGFCFCFFALSYYFSWGSIPWVYSAEIFPYRARAKASAITTGIHYFSAIISSNMLQMWLLDHGSSVESFVFCFLTLGSASLGLTLFVWMAMPETKGLMLEDMEELFRVDNSAYCCACLPYVSTGFLGMRSLKPVQKPIIVIGHNNTMTITNYNSIIGPGIEMNERIPLYEPRMLHKYSSDMREVKFHYTIHDVTEDEEKEMAAEPLVHDFVLHNNSGSYSQLNNPSNAAVISANLS